GEPANTVPPRSARRAFILGSSRPALTSLLSLSTISAGVAPGAPMPYQAVASWPGTNSPTVGVSGGACVRIAVVTPKARILTDLMYSIEEGTEPNCCGTSTPFSGTGLMASSGSFPSASMECGRRAGATASTLWWHAYGCRQG